MPKMKSPQTDNSDSAETVASKVAIETLLEQLSTRHNASQWGWTELIQPPRMAFYRQWIAENHHADMQYLESQMADKENPQQLGQPHQPWQSAFVFLFRYTPHPAPHPRTEQAHLSLKVASYAKGQDYHFWLQENLEKIIVELQSQFPQESFRAFTDSKPVLERDLAQRAGLGWIGKNTCLIHPQDGSFFLIGEIYSTLRCEITAKKNILPDFCGTCQRCMVACPTGALVEERKLDSRRCISYWTIESQNTPPPELRDKFSGWFFGCDICQEVCPWNEKFLRKNLEIKTSTQFYEENLTKDRQQVVNELRRILTLSFKKLVQEFAGTPLTRSRGFGLKRNALLVVAHEKLVELKPEIKALAENDRLKDLALWCLKKLDE